jgi:TPR repeat protein
MKARSSGLGSMGNVGVDWTKEPDMEALNHAFGLLSSDPEQGLVELKALADRGSIASMLYIAHTYRKLKGDLPQSTEWYRRAMNAGSLIGAHELGRNYFDAKNYLSALDAFKVGEGNDYAPSIHMLGLMYRNGFGVEKDIDKARNLFERAAALGHAHARGHLGVLLLTGRYGPRQFVRGLRLWLGLLRYAYRLAYNDPFDDRLR